MHLQSRLGSLDMAGRSVVGRGVGETEQQQVQFEASAAATPPRHATPSSAQQHHAIVEL